MPIEPTLLIGRCSKCGQVGPGLYYKNHYFICKNCMDGTTHERVTHSVDWDSIVRGIQA